MTETDWYKCHSEGWSGIIHDAAMVHPAKFSRALIRRIYDHCFEEGWLARGDIVIDPFGGVGLGALHAMRHGLNWIGVELEEKFVALGQQNIELWNERYSCLPRWGGARIVQGDSRRLGEVLAGAELCLSSPPYAGEGELNRNRSSERYWRERPKSYKTPGRAACHLGYGSTPGQLGGMQEGSFEAVVSSPPFEQSLTNKARASDPASHGLRADGTKRGGSIVTGDYGDTEGQLAAMREGALADAVISSPPFESVETCQDKSFKLNDGRKAPPQGQDGYGATVGQLGRETGDTFWSASHTILEQVYQVLIPGGHAVFVLKAFVRKGKIVDFPGQWRELCEAVGFTTLHLHRAWLVEERGAQYTLEGELDVRRVKKCSFFRRLHERKFPHLAIDYEEVLCLVK